jgi:hypothetical protein
MLDRDKLTNANSQESSRATMAVADAVQRFKPEEQVLGAAAFFLMICDTYGVYPGTALTTISNMMRGNKIHARDQFNAARMYIQEEIKKHG